MWTADALARQDTCIQRIPSLYAAVQVTRAFNNNCTADSYAPCRRSTSKPRAICSLHSRPCLEHLVPSESVISSPPCSLAISLTCSPRRRDPSSHRPRSPPSAARRPFGRSRPLGSTMCPSRFAGVVRRARQCRGWTTSPRRRRTAMSHEQSGRA